MPKKDKERKVRGVHAGESLVSAKSKDSVIPPLETFDSVPVDDESMFLTSLESDGELDGRKPRTNILIVGIGASAGGLKAFRAFLEAAPPETGMAFVLVPHLDPRHESMMVDLLSQRTTMSLKEAKQGTKVEADHVYVIPPNKYMQIRDGQLHLTTPGEPPARPTAIDFFFQSLAEDQQELAVGIVLSGTGSHGTPGLREVKLAGGMVMAQDPRTAEYDQMPQSVIDARLADYILAPQDMPAALISYARNPYLNHPDLEKNGDPLQEEMGRILAILRSRTRYDFRWYRKKMMMRRVRRRMGLRRIEEPAAYLKFLRDTPEEIQALYKDMLIGVTGFFREPESFRALEEQVLPDLVTRSAGKTPLRVWVPGCATGEEPYSLAMQFVEQFQAIGKPPNFQIFATDIDTESLARARDGLYSSSIAADVTPERLHRFFIPMDRHYQIRHEVRDAVVFAPQNLISDAPFSRLDLISCRNLLIYLEFPLQQRIISLFHFTLREGGYLALGASESVGRHVDLFEPVSKKWRIFRRVGTARREPHNTQIPLTTANYNPITVVEPHVGSHLPLGEVMRRLLLDAYAPASVLINRNCEVLAFHGNTVEYLEFPSGEPSRDLMALLRSGLRAKVRAALQKALSNSGKIQTSAHVKRGSSYIPCRIDISVVREPKEATGLYLVTFYDEQPGETALAPEVATIQIEESSLVTQLENDLKTTREDLQITIEELESSNEELKAANEEMMSMNEELQSANEELETSKEELQSLNEELTTVNSQLTEKVEELDSAYTDITNFLTSSDIATIFLDRDMRIRKFTPPTRKLFNVVSSDIGRPLADLSFRIDDPSLLDEARKVLDHLSASEREVQTNDGRSYIRRILPYRSRANRIEGVTVTFIEISERKKQELKLNEALAGLEEEVARRTSALTMIRDVAIQANAAQSVEEILEIVLRRICDYTGWEVAFAYCATHGDDPAEEGDSHFVPVVAWSAKATRDSDRLRNAMASSPLIPEQDLTGRAWSTGLPQWTPELNHDFPAAVTEAAAILQLRSAYAFPIQDNRSVGALLVFMGKNMKEPGPRTLEILSSVANQISLVMERERLSRQVREMSAYEQIRLSQDLHDAIGQQLAGLSMSAEVISRNLANTQSEEAPALAEVVRGLRETLQQIRLLARGLAEIPVGPGVLAIALEQLCANNPAVLHSTLACRTEVDKTVDIQDPDVAIHLYRIAQEAVHNAVVHSHGKSLHMVLKQDKKSITMEVNDDGIGLAKLLRYGMGLRTMRHRARLIGATLEIRSEQGTRITVRVPKGEKGHE